MRRSDEGGGAAHIVFVLQGLGAGGSEHIVSRVSSHFAAKGNKVTVLAFEERGAEPYYDHHPSVTIMPLGHKSKRMGSVAAIRYMLERRRLLKSAFSVLQPDLVVSFLTRTNILSVLAAGRDGPPVIVSERNNPAAQKIGTVWEALRRHTYARASALVTMTRGAMALFAPADGRRDHVIPNPATLPDEIAGPRVGGTNLVAVGRFVPQKGFDRLIRAFARASQAIPDWKLTIWGDGPDRPALEALRDRLGLTDRIAMPGISAEPGAWLDSADVFVLSSRFEGWGLVLSEAMAAGRPVIATDCDFGPADMIADPSQGLLVPDGDLDALAGAMERLCSDAALRERMGAAARQRMRAFDPDRVLAMWEEVIDGALARHREGAA
ncbi:glycosyltransferase family 4 protein [Aurantiacibacter spongiae]|uniref:Glycosyltransferase family 4 protein n=2 Tax=Aurantiacibacter spongiae TaxID=2488860 RepID=A0A3N5DCY5_9SPHN|nr:glycosyltransferase family 4 protein [Aurantiacibacter spongiae]